MKRLSSSLVALIAAAPLVTPLPTMAQDDFALDEIVVSALRTAAERLRTGVSVSVVDTEDLAREGDTQLATYLARLPGVAVAQTGPLGTQTVLRVRGAEPRYLAVYVDGIRVDDPTGIRTEFDFGALSTADIARVEVLRGSQSALWGGSAVGGVINITTRAATAEGLTQTVATEAGSYGTQRLSYGLTFRDDRVELGLNLSHVRSDGFSAFDTLPPTAGLEDDGFEANRLSFSARYKINDVLTVGGALFVQDAANDYDGFLSDTAVNRQDRREHGVRLFAEIDAGATEHVLSVSRYRIDRTLTQGAVSNFTGERLAFAYQGTTEASPALTLTYGLDWMEESAFSAALPTGRETRLYGVWAQGLWTPADGLDVSLSLRADRNSAFGSQPSGRLAFAWQVSEALTLRGAASTGFRAPSLYEQFGDPTSTIVPNLALTPEESRSLEIGADIRPTEWMTVSGTLFRIGIDNAITYLPCPSGPPLWVCAPGTTNIYDNVAGTSVRKGVELSSEFALGETALVGLSYTYTDARDPAGARLLRVPRHSLALTLSGDLAPKLAGSATLQHVAGRPAEFGTPAGDYTVLNAGLTYGLNDETDLTLRIDNVLDEVYQVVPGYGTSRRAAYVGLRAAF